MSLAFGISVLIVYMLLLTCCKKCNKKKGDTIVEVANDEEDGVKQLLLAKPHTSTLPPPEPKTYETVLVTRENGVPLQETTISSDSTLLTRKKKGVHAEVISTIKRTHSIDEGTQTDIEEFGSTDMDQPRTLSIREAQELGDLVSNMNYYNSRIDDDDAFYPQVSGSFTSVSKSDKSQSFRTENTSTSGLNHHNKSQDSYYYANRGPSFENGRNSTTRSGTLDRQPLLPRNNSAPIPPSPYHLRYNYQQKSLSRNPSELSYNTSASDSSIATNDIPNTIPNGERMRHTSIQRTPKPGVRGDGYEFINHK